MSSGPRVQNLGDIAQSIQGAVHLLNWTALLDVFLVATILYSLYLLIKETRALRILYGILVLAVLYLIGQFLNLTALNFLLQSVFAVTLVAIPVVFQPELRAALERLGRGELVAGILTPSSERTRGVVGELVTAVKTLHEKKTGGLIVLERSTGLKDLIDGGVIIDSAVTAELLLTIFHTNTPLHDGAVIIRAGRVAAASVFLPLAQEPLHHSLGTRHRAALGLAKESDAAVVVVSEETGQISIAHGRTLHRIAPSDLERRLKLLFASGKRTS